METSGNTCTAFRSGSPCRSLRRLLFRLVAVASSGPFLAFNQRNGLAPFTRKKCLCAGGRVCRSIAAKIPQPCAVKIAVLHCHQCHLGAFLVSRFALHTVSGAPLHFRSDPIYAHTLISFKHKICCLYELIQVSTEMLMNEKRIAYIRPMRRYSEQGQRELVSTYAPTVILMDDLDALRNYMRKAGRVLIVPQLATIDRKRHVVADVVKHTLEHGCAIIEARHDRTITPDCIDAVMAGLEAPRHDVDRRKARKSGKAGGERTKYTPAQLNATKAIWQSAELTYANARELTATDDNPGGISYSTMQRHWLDRDVPVRRPVGPGRR